MTDDLRKKIGTNINNLLALRNMTQKELAKRIGVTDNTISYFCNGKRTPNIEQIISISKVMNISADYILGLSETATSDKDLQYICDYTGLSDESVKFLHHCKEHNDSGDINVFDDEYYMKDEFERERQALILLGMVDVSFFLNQFIQDISFLAITSELSSYRKYYLTEKNDEVLKEAERIIDNGFGDFADSEEFEDFTEKLHRQTEIDEILGYKRYSISKSFEKFIDRYLESFESSLKE